MHRPVSDAQDVDTPTRPAAAAKPNPSPFPAASSPSVTSFLPPPPAQRDAPPPALLPPPLLLWPALPHLPPHQRLGGSLGHGGSGSRGFLRTVGMASSKFELQSPWGASNESSKHPFRFEGNHSLSSGDASHFHFSPAASPKVSLGLEEPSLNPGLPSPLPAPTSGPWRPSNSASRPPGGRSVTFNQDPDVFAVYDREESWEQSPASSQSLFGDGFLGARPRTPLVPSPRSDEEVFKLPTAPPGSSRTSTSSET